MTPPTPNLERCARLAREAIAALELDLRGLVVLTEAATGAYALTAGIAALAGADRVLTLSGDSAYGSAVAARAATDAAAAALCGPSGPQALEHLSGREDPRVGDADIVTNLGFVRPVDAALTARLKPTAAVPLMWETWEFRPEDLDLAACRAAGLPVLGTDEAHPCVGTVRYIGLLALRLLLDLEVEVLRSRVCVIGFHDFGDAIEAALSAAGATVSRPAASTDAILAAVAGADAVVLAEHRRRDTLLAHGGLVDPAALVAAAPGLAVAHVCGGADRDALVAAGVRCAPERFAPISYMSVRTDALGPRPLIDLHTAGLAVGAALARARRAGLGRLEAEIQVLRMVPFAGGFADTHAKAHA